MAAPHLGNTWLESGREDRYYGHIPPVPGTRHWLSSRFGAPTDGFAAATPVCARPLLPYRIGKLLRRLRLGDGIYDCATRKFLWLRFALSERSLGGGRYRALRVASIDNGGRDG